MGTYTFVESTRQETIRISPIIIIPLMIAFIFAALECLSSRSYAKAFEERKYKRNVLMNASSLTKVDLEIKELTAR